MLKCFYALCFDYGALNVVLHRLWIFSAIQSFTKENRTAQRKCQADFPFLKYFNLLNKWPNRLHQDIFLCFVLTLMIIRCQHWCLCIGRDNGTSHSTPDVSDPAWYQFPEPSQEFLNLLCFWKETVCRVLPFSLRRECAQCIVSRRHTRCHNTGN
jgi:hypothetical protein